MAQLWYTENQYSLTLNLGKIPNNSKFYLTIFNSFTHYKLNIAL